MTKRCSKCGEAQALSEFSPSSPRGNYLQPCCKACRRRHAERYYHKNRIEILAKRALEKEKRRMDRIYRVYGLLPAAFEHLLSRSGNRCEVCGSPPGNQALVIDHCHVTKEVRGLLCGSCNRMLAKVVCAPGWFAKALAYLAGPKVKTMSSLIQMVADSSESGAGRTEEKQ